MVLSRTSRSLRTAAGRLASVGYYPVLMYTTRMLRLIHKKATQHSTEATPTSENSIHAKFTTSREGPEPDKEGPDLAGSYTITSPAISATCQPLQQTLEQQDRDHHQDDHNQYVNQIVRT